MSDSSTINARLQATLPAAWSCLSDLGQRLYYPLGIPAQAREAKACPVNATIGQITDGRGGAIPLPTMVKNVRGLPPEKVVLYTPPSGNPQLRDLWARRLQEQGCGTLSHPLVTQGLTHGLSLVADLFAGPGSQVFLPSPGWGNYSHIFGTRRGAQLCPYSSVSMSGMDLDSIDRALSSARPGAVLVLNFPSNPIGYSPTLSEARALVERVVAHPHPLVVVTDDAYQGMVWEPGLLSGSLFPMLSRETPEHILPIKIDGATKELFFFGGRVGFLSFGCDAEPGAVLVEKAHACIRATISSGATISQNLVLQALLDPALESQTRELREQIRERYLRLKAALLDKGIPSWPFNSAFFTLLPVRRDPDALRRELLARGVGVVSIPQASALRLSYASVALEDLEGLVRSLRETLGA